MILKRSTALIVAVMAAAASGSAAYADSPSNAEQAFKVPSTITFTPTGIAIVPTVDTWMQGTSPTGAGCCLNYFHSPNGKQLVTTPKNHVASSFKIGSDGVAENCGFEVDSYDANDVYVGSVFSEAPTFCLYAAPLQEDARRSGLSYHGNWFETTGGTPWGGGQELSTTPGDSVTFNCGECRSIEWITTTGPHQGSAAVYINGALVATVDTHAATTHYRQAVFHYELPSIDTFSTIKIVNQSSGKDAAIDLDAFVRTFED